MRSAKSTAFWGQFKTSSKSRAFWGWIDDAVVAPVKVIYTAIIRIRKEVR